MANEIKRIDIKEFRERGYLHEINRLLLHPLGLALEVNIGADGTEILDGVWDYRDHAEGIYYGDDLLSAEKAKAVMAEMFARRDGRIRELHYVIQPIPGERVLTVNYTDPESETPQTQHVDGVGEVEFER